VLQTYKSSSIEHRLFIPFKDETSGKEIYGAGGLDRLNEQLLSRIKS